ncbi:energy coupling factor transporter S component ThiW [Caldanaerobius fijiensis DSM 17918]|uniref:Energy coupling factor transporter S component ThiW n=1 Tax=Caldanaerobius fijiensis DSM 17918 TaxID=1121256 RepID=A0A1M4Y3A2_9THEO|nr:energy coupling factor transporter S component ThiW [Caldanaerobius fijiensis]SHF00056.1 energy coupling factor transporter S component ThiW [Caldanaerobius fijiensis DSM 17918]
MNRVQRMVLMALIVAIGTFTAQYTWFSVGVAKAAPVQHAINVISAVLFGPWGALEVAFVIGLLRNLLGVGSLLAFPGGMVGAFLAGYLYRLTGKLYFAPIGEVIGTGIIGALLSYPIAKYILGSSGAAFMFVAPFSLSSGIGAIIGYTVILALASRISVLAQDK